MILYSVAVISVDRVLVETRLYVIRYNLHLSRLSLPLLSETTERSKLYRGMLQIKPINYYVKTLKYVHVY